MVLLTAGAILLRQSGTPAWDTIWAEDGSVFVSDAVSHPLPETLLRPYAGYAHVIPRIIASLVGRLPFGSVAGAIAVISALTVAGLAWFVVVASEPLLRSPLRQGLLGLAMVGLPALPYELTATLANLQWFLPLPCLFALAFPVRRVGAWLVRATILLLAPLSSPLCVGLAPIALWRLSRGKRGRARILPSIYLGAVAIQLSVWLRAEQVSPESVELVDTVSALPQVFTTRVLAEPLFGVPVVRHVWPTARFAVVAVAASTILVLLVAVFRRSTPTARRWIVALAGGGVITFALAMLVRSDVVVLMAPGSSYVVTAPRYAVVPTLLILTALLVPPEVKPRLLTEIDDRPPPQPDLAAEWRALVLGALWVVVAIVPSFRATTPRSLGPSWANAVEFAQDRCLERPDSDPLVEISPYPVWVMRVECDRL